MAVRSSPRSGRNVERYKPSSTEHEAFGKADAQQPTAGTTTHTLATRSRGDVKQASLANSREEGRSREAEPVERPSLTRSSSDPAHPPSRPNLNNQRNKFDLEPNPFEQSFRRDSAEPTSGPGSRRARSGSPTYAPGKTPGGKVSLPGINSIASPSPGSHNPGLLTSLGWGINSSLRSGPLSPALLNGPAATSGFNNGSTAVGVSNGTGLTPLVGFGSTGGGAFTPGTQALFNMITNQTSTVSTPNNGKTVERNTFDSSFCAANADTNTSATAPTNPASGQNDAPTRRVAEHQPQPREVSDLQRSAVANGSAPAGIPASGGQRGAAPTPAPYAHDYHAGGQAAGFPSQSHFVHSSPLNASHPGTATGNGVNPSAAVPPPGANANNPLYLLSAAQEGLAAGNVYVDDATVVAAAALTGLGGGQNPGSSQPGAVGVFPPGPSGASHTSMGPNGHTGHHQGGAVSRFQSQPPHSLSGSRPAPAPASVSRPYGGGHPGLNGVTGPPPVGQPAHPYPGMNGYQGQPANMPAAHQPLANTSPPSAAAGRRGKAAPAPALGSASIPPAPASEGKGRKRKLTEDKKPVKGKGGKKVKVLQEEDDDDGEDDENGDEASPDRGAGTGADGKPETDEEKRKNFLERNRQAALKCRQRKKAWLQNLQAKVEYLTTDNDNLQATIGQLREEIASLRNILLAHKDCPIALQMAGGGGGGGPPAPTAGAAAGIDSPAAPQIGPGRGREGSVAGAGRNGTVGNLIAGGSTNAAAAMMIQSRPPVAGGAVYGAY